MPSTPAALEDVRVDVLNVKNAAQCHTRRSTIVLSFLLRRHHRQSTGFGADVFESLCFERDLFDLIGSSVDQGTDYLLYPFQFWNLGPKCYSRLVTHEFLLAIDEARFLRQCDP